MTTNLHRKLPHIYTDVTSGAIFRGALKSFNFTPLIHLVSRLGRLKPNTHYSLGVRSREFAGPMLTVIANSELSPFLIAAGLGIFLSLLEPALVMGGFAVFLAMFAGAGLMMQTLLSRILAEC